MKTRLMQLKTQAGRTHEALVRLALAPVVALACSPVFAQSSGTGLPTMNSPNEALGGGQVAQGDWLGSMGAWIRAGLTIIALVVVSLGFVYALMGALGKWRGYSMGRFEMSDVIEYFAMAAVLGVFLVVIATYALNVLTGSTTP